MLLASSATLLFTAGLALYDYVKKKNEDSGRDES